MLLWIEMGAAKNFNHFKIKLSFKDLFFQVGSPTTIEKLWGGFHEGYGGFGGFLSSHQVSMAKKKIVDSSLETNRFKMSYAQIVSNGISCVRACDLNKDKDMSAGLRVNTNSKKFHLNSERKKEVKCSFAFSFVDSKFWSLCYKWGDQNHRAIECRNPINCRRCGKFGHKFKTSKIWLREQGFFNYPWYWFHRII